jgi:hypothetical protein
MKVDDFYVQNSQDFKNPTIVQVLPAKTTLSVGVPEVVETVNN